ncbi:MULTISPECIES: hypothetical protein [Hungatella]|uniref:hypothetical protein n=1 Tax=Hungatella TaxID=1649459 RepID=UPI0011DE53F4|nr:hypothetical protein [Hungatella hathewayi]
MDPVLDSMAAEGPAWVPAYLKSQPSQDCLLKTKLSTSEVFSILSHQGALVYPGTLITSEPIKKMKDIYKHFKIKCPEEIPYAPTEDEYSRM